MGKSLDTAFLLTAGIGSRLRPHTELCPKPKLPFLGLPLCFYSFFLCKKAGLENFLFNLHHQPEQIKEMAQALSSLTSSLFFSDETKELLGSGGAFWGARSFLENQSAFLVANSDEVMIPTKVSILEDLKTTFEKDKPLTCLLVTDHPELMKSLKPVWIDQNNQVLGFGMEKPTQNCSPVHFTGYKIYDSRILNELPEGPSNIFYDVLVQSIAHGEKVTVCYEKNLPWFETGNFSSYIEATKSCLELMEKDDEYFSQIFSFYGKKIKDWQIQRRDENILFKPKSFEIPQDFVWEGVVCLGENVKVGNKVHLSNVIVADNAIIQDNELLDNTFVFE